MKNERKNIIDKTKSWIDSFVIQLNLCPFAAKPFRDNKIEYKISNATSKENALMEFHQVADFFLSQPKEKLSNLFLIFPQGFQDFRMYLELFELCEYLLEEQNFNESIQLASFHPQYQFAQTDLDDPANYSNRSPYPMIHFLRIEEVADALQNIPNPEEIPERNIQLLRELGIDKIKKHL